VSDFILDEALEDLKMAAEEALQPDRYLV